MGRILVVDDEPNMRRILASHLRQDKHEVMEASGVDAARSMLSAHDFDVIFTDQRMPDGDGLEVLAAVKDINPTVSVVFLTAIATIQLAVESMRQGAFDFLTKPFQAGVVCAAANRAFERTRLLRENDLLKGTVVRLEGANELYGDSAAMQDVRQKIARVAPTNATVLVTGETGTGKELVARAIHRNSTRANRPFVAVNCAAFTETLLESELFGHEKGAFTGADRIRQGLFEAAHEGTLFLDEAGEMSPAAQAKLLRVLTDGQVVRIGSVKSRTVDVRVLVATHRDLQQRVKEGLFRDDLYYRLAVVPIYIPPLRERREDIRGLCELLSQQVAAELKLAPRALTEEAIENLVRYDFPGNVREMRNLIERAYILSGREEIGAEHFPVSQGNDGHGASVTTMTQAFVQPMAEIVQTHFDLTALLESTEKDLILRMLTRTGGAQAEAARRMGLSRSALAYKLNKYGIKVTSDS
ncbi:MAG TPA: sigma-54 dependent transcriptional regulator [Terriglobales bacterium]|jgi:DNA-binding NtrC family response regulator|nr:sigma-54 dependent transcriptional regulator [Terriglobales bacterium]